MNEFKVNEYITLKLIENKTKIYINNEFFRKCKFLFLNLSVSEIRSFDEIESIDDAAEKLDHSLENAPKERFNIPPKTEFWGHCSNLQVWAENGYDTRLLHRNLAFPLLKRLTEVGDSIAIQVFKEEIGKRIKSGSKTVFQYLKNQGYLSYLNKAELESILDLNFYSKLIDKYSKLIDKNHAKILALLELTIGKKFHVLDNYSDFFIREDMDYDECYTIIDRKHIIEIGFKQCHLKIFPALITNITSLQFLYLYGNKLTTIPETITNLRELRVLNLRSNKLTTIPETITNLRELRVLNLRSNKLTTIPEPIAHLHSLVNLNLSENWIEHIPESIKSLVLLRRLELYDNFLKDLPDSLIQLKSLQVLNLGANKFRTFPEIITRLNSLQQLNLQGNFLTNIPKTIKYLYSLQKLGLGGNNFSNFPTHLTTLKSLRELWLNNNNYISDIPEAIENLSSLGGLYLDGNQLKTLPKSIENLKLLEILNLGKNNLEMLPNSIENLKSLKVLDLSGNKLLKLSKSIENLNGHCDVILKEKKDKWGRDFSSSSTCSLCNKKLRFSRGCSFTEVRIDGIWYDRVPSTSYFHCHDCNAEYHQEHHLGCDAERCPVCDGQMIWCNCVGNKEAIRDAFGNIIYLHFGAEPDQAKFIEDLIIANSLNSYDLLFSDEEWSESQARIKVDYPSRDIVEANLGYLGISIIPKSIKYLNKLIVLNLENNQINELPESINNLISLRELNLYGNPLVNNPNSTTKALLKLLRERNINIKNKGEKKSF